MDISSEAKYLNTFSNSKYPAKIGTKLGNEADLSTAMSYLRKCVDVESFTIALLGTMLITVCASFGYTLLVKLGSVFEFGL